MSKVFVVTELVSIDSEKVTETVDVIETEVSPSEGELDVIVGGVVSEILSSVSLQEVMARIKRDIKKKFTILFIFTLFRNEKNRLVLLMCPFVIHQYTYVLHIHLY